MAILDRDGKVYKLRGPNPLVPDRKDWDMLQVAFLNKESFGATEVAEDACPISEDVQPMRLPDGSHIVSPYEFITELSTTKGMPEPQESLPDPEPILVPPAPTPAFEPPPPTKNPDPRLAKIFAEHGAVFECSPVEGGVFGKPFSFEAITAAESDMQIQIWCTVRLSPGSVFTKRQRDALWWQVQSFTEKSGGWLILGAPSRLNPSF